MTPFNSTVRPLRGIAPHSTSHPNFSCPPSKENHRIQLFFLTYHISLSQRPGRVEATLICTLGVACSAV